MRRVTWSDTRATGALIGARQTVRKNPARTFRAGRRTCVERRVSR